LKPLSCPKKEANQNDIPQGISHAREYVCEEKVLELHWAEGGDQDVPECLQELLPRSQVEDVEGEEAQED
jgi:agmatine/peptidylarginine deiminase